MEITTNSWKSNVKEIDYSYSTQDQSDQSTLLLLNSCAFFMWNCSFTYWTSK